MYRTFVSVVAILVAGATHGDDPQPPMANDATRVLRQKLDAIAKEARDFDRSERYHITTIDFLRYLDHEPDEPPVTYTYIFAETNAPETGINVLSWCAVTDHHSPYWNTVLIDDGSKKVFREKVSPRYPTGSDIKEIDASGVPVGSDPDEEKATIRRYFEPYCAAFANPCSMDAAASRLSELDFLRDETYLEHAEYDENGDIVATYLGGKFQTGHDYVAKLTLSKTVGFRPTRVQSYIQKGPVVILQGQTDTVWEKVDEVYRPVSAETTTNIFGQHHSYLYETHYIKPDVANELVTFDQDKPFWRQQLKPIWLSESISYPQLEGVF